jgi:hypothetical protein
MSALSSDELISTALKKLGNETLTEDAQVWICNILDRLYEDVKWPFLEKTATGALTSGQSSVDLPTDFDSPWDVDSFVLIDSEGGQYPLAFNTQYDQDLITAPSITGSPRTALINLRTMTWRPYPLPETAYTWQVRYRMKPDERAATYVDFTPAFPNDQILIQALFVEGLQHEDDDRYPQELAILTQMVARYRGKFNIYPNRAKQVRFASRFSTPTSYR